MKDDTREFTTGSDLDADQRGFDFAWARSSPTHELSAHGRHVRRRLDTRQSKPVRPSLWKRLRFAIYRMRTGR